MGENSDAAQLPAVVHAVFARVAVARRTAHLRVKDVFATWDADHDGLISFSDFRRGASRTGVRASEAEWAELERRVPMLSFADFRALIAEHDVGASGMNAANSPASPRTSTSAAELGFVSPGHQSVGTSHDAQGWPLRSPPHGERAARRDAQGSRAQRLGLRDSSPTRTAAHRLALHPRARWRPGGAEGKGSGRVSPPSPVLCEKEPIRAALLSASTALSEMAP